MKLTTAKIAVLAAVAFATSLPAAAANNNVGSTSEQVLTAEVRSALLKLPYYSVFDNLNFTVAGSSVTLSGDVTRPWLKSQAEKAVASIKGVDGVSSTINVLPLSSFDDRIRIAVLNRVYGQPSLNKYAHINAPIRIIVANGNVRLEGVVLNEGDRIIANMMANSVSGVFSVENKLKLENEKI